MFFLFLCGSLCILDTSLNKDKYTEAFSFLSLCSTGGLDLRPHPDHILLLLVMPLSLCMHMCLPENNLGGHPSGAMHLFEKGSLTGQRLASSASPNWSGNSGALPVSISKTRVRNPCYCAQHCFTQYWDLIESIHVCVEALYWLGHLPSPRFFFTVVVLLRQGHT